ncbi:O-antigen ligase domain-containing protein [Flavobacterium amnicola]|uniref:O-antigen ligase domain-containing protein n=1 Tax=Flavobacterium amnicola TaxID=2506422 RepID=A0A4Q1K157_9FLAO|nr:O-antigen ligase family protein [Flavobacterium amnicola]RXR17741.1 O-antigen ligase domain-containing protein [Flavobacterium amnicola]
MEVSKKTLTYTSLVLIHILLGIVIFLNTKISVIYSIAILSLSFLILLKTQNKKNEVLFVAAYAVGSEIVLRMAGGFLFYEIAKYSIVFFMLMGIYFSGFSKNSFLYWVFLLSLIPGVLVASVTLNLNANIIKSLSFNLSGPLCLGICSMYCYQRRITLKDLDHLMLTMLLPLLTAVTYMYLYNPSIKNVITSTESNFETSGGFGPNQVSTMIGLAIFLMFTRVIFYSKERWVIVLNITLLMILTFRGLVTFSRGGMICSAIMVALLILVLFFVTKRKAKIKIIWSIVFSLIALTAIWMYSSEQTNGLIDKRYANQDKGGRVKESILTGREVIMEGEFEMFLQNPIMGIGIGKAKEYRLDTFGEVIASHNEITRMMAEHGAFGVLALLILIMTPLTLYINNRQHIYLLSFFTFWILTINHAAMRLAAPAFVYALSLVQVYIVEKAKDNPVIEELE